MRTLSRAAAIVGFMALGSVTLAACNTEEETSGSNVCDEMATEYEAYSAGLTKIGDDGNFKVAIMSALPAPPERGMNSWMIQLKDMNDAPLTGATITSVTPFMPEHGHGSGTTPVIGAADANGEISVEDIDFMMPGVWTVTVDVDNGGLTDTATFAFCIDG